MEIKRYLMSKKRRESLLPVRHPNDDFFVCDIFDAAPKSDSASMEFPLFSLSSKPDHHPRYYEKDNTWLKLTPSKLGLATIHDRDILIYCISQCMSQLNKEKKVSKTLRFQASDLLKVTNRQTSGNGYALFQDALKRLQGTQIETNIAVGGKTRWTVFSFIDQSEIIKEDDQGKMQEIEITLSDWVFNAINEQGGDILTISRDYFRLRKPIERRMYEIARKHVGTKNKSWSFLLQTLHEKSGSKSPMYEFKRMLLKFIDNQDHMPDYTFTYEPDANKVVIYPKSSFKKAYIDNKETDETSSIILKTKTYELAKQHCDKLDVYHIEAEWRKLLLAKKSTPTNPELVKNLESGIMNLHSNLKQLEGKYIDLANFYKKELV